MGRKNANHTALFFAGSGILLCGFSRSMEMLILSRFVSYLYVLSISPDTLSDLRNWWWGTSDDFFVCLPIFKLKSRLSKFELHRIIVSDMYSLRVTSFHFPLLTPANNANQNRGLAQGVANVFSGVSVQLDAVAIM
jgi:hypothetical protein